MYLTLVKTTKFSLNPLSANKSKCKWLYASTRLAFWLRRPLSLFNFNHWWFRFRTCRNVFSCCIQHVALKGL